MEFEVVAQNRWINNLKNHYKSLIPFQPDMILFDSGTFSNVIGMLHSGRFQPNIVRLHISGKPFELDIEPDISEVRYQILTSEEDPQKIEAANIYMTFSLPHSHGQVDRALDRAPKVIEIISNEIKEALRKRALLLGNKEIKQTIIRPVCPGSTSLAYSYMLNKKFREDMPYAYYTSVYQINELPEVSVEEVQRRLDLMIRDVTLQTSINYIVHYPHISSLGGYLSDKLGEFNDKLIEFLEFLIELHAVYQGSLKIRGSFPSSEFELSRLYEQSKIMLVSTVNYGLVSLDKVKWFIDVKLLGSLINEFKDRGYIIGLFSSTDMVNSIKNIIGSNTRVVAVPSRKFERKYVLTMTITEDEFRALLEKTMGPKK